MSRFCPNYCMCTANTFFSLRFMANEMQKHLLGLWWSLHKGVSFLDTIHSFHEVPVCQHNNYVNKIIQLAHYIFVYVIVHNLHWNMICSMIQSFPLNGKQCVNNIEGQKNVQSREILDTLLWL
jgi:hypothetical protein